MKKTIMEHDKENKGSNLELKGKKKSKNLSKDQNKKAKPKEPNTSLSYAVQNNDGGLKESNNSLTSAQKTDIQPDKRKIVNVGFWSKKLQDLEKSTMKSKKTELYEFSFTDDSDSTFKIKKQPRKKGRAPKKRQPTQPKYKKPFKKPNKPLTPEKNIDSRPLPKKDTINKRERKQSTDEHKSIPLLTGLQATAFTSTPAVNRKNVVDPSNFLFLSPIIKEETECFNKVDEEPPTRLNSSDGGPVLHLDQETPKIETRLRRISCRRVLRNGKMLNK